MTLNQKKELRRIFSSHPEVKLVYFFGSRAVNNAGPLSDYDFAVYLDEKNPKKQFKIKIRLIKEIERLLKTEKIDVVVLNSADKPELKYAIIHEGQLIYEQEPFRVLVEPKILNEYFDFIMMLRRYHLTRA